MTNAGSPRCFSVSLRRMLPFCPSIFCHEPPVCISMPPAEMAKQKRCLSSSNSRAVMSALSCQYMPMNGSSARADNAEPSNKRTRILFMDTASAYFPLHFVCAGTAAMILFEDEECAGCLNTILTDIPADKRARPCRHNA